MNTLTTEKNITLPVSEMAEHLIGSEIIKLANEVNEKIKKGEKIHNLTIGDFDPKIFPIPAKLCEAIIKAYKEGHTNYPMANGVPELRKAVSNFIREKEQLDYSTDEILIAGGARPLIYGIFSTLVDPGDKILFPVPSWNNNHYCHLLHAGAVLVETRPENHFMPTAEELKPFIQDVRMVALCSPLNPTGTVFTKKNLEDICDLIIHENQRRGSGQKPLYLMYDQIYWVLTHGDVHHYNPVSLRPEMRNYTVFVDGISKAFAATGIRVGWAMGPQFMIDKMKSILSHIGAWAPKAEQVAAAQFINDKAAVDEYLLLFKKAIEERLQEFYRGFNDLNKQGFKVRAIAPQAAIYLTVQFDLKGMKLPDGHIIQNTEDITSYILNEAKMALVPFSSFGSSPDSTWYRLSVGTCKTEDIEPMLRQLKKALSGLK